MYWTGDLNCHARGSPASAWWGGLPLPPPRAALLSPTAARARPPPPGALFLSPVPFPPLRLFRLMTLMPRLMWKEDGKARASLACEVNKSRGGKIGACTQNAAVATHQLYFRPQNRTALVAKVLTRLRFSKAKCRGPTSRWAKAKRGYTKCCCPERDLGVLLVILG